MTVSDDRLGLGEPARNITPRRPASIAPPTDAADLLRYLRASAARADVDDLVTAYRNCDVAIAAATRWNSPAGLSAAYSLRTLVARRLGDLPGAEHDGEVASRTLAGRPHDAAAILLAARRMATRLDAGDVAGAQELLGGLGSELPGGAGALALRYARARLYAASGRPGEALADLFFCGERLAARQADWPSVLPWRSAAAAILVSIGTAEAAGRLVAAEVDLARRYGPPSAVGRALRVEGTVPGGPGLAALDEAVRVLTGSPRRFEYAQALVDFGVALNAARRRSQARRMLRRGLEIATECGSPALMERAGSGYAAAGGKVRHSIPSQRTDDRT